MSVVCIHQPDFAPWLGFFERLVKADVWVVMDDVQFLRRAWHHRDKVLGPDGPRWLTVPVKKKGRYEQKVAEVEIDSGEDWRRRHLRTLECFYARATCRDEGLAFYSEILAQDHERLIDLNLAIIDGLLDRLGIEVEVVHASKLGIESSSTERLVDTCRALGATRYVTGTGSRDYLDETLFDAAGIELTWQAFEHPRYDQGRDDFAPGLSTLDALLHLGPDLKMLLDVAAIS